MRTMYFANRLWNIIGTNGSLCYLRSVVPLDFTPPTVDLTDMEHTWEFSELRNFLNVEYLYLFPVEDLSAIVPISNEYYVGSQRIIVTDRVWIAEIDSIRRFQMLDECVRMDLAGRVYPCLAIDLNESKQRIVDEFSELYNDGYLDEIDTEFATMLDDSDFSVTTPLQLFLLMWYNAECRDQLELLFEAMTAHPFTEFIKQWIKTGNKNKEEEAK